LITRYEWNNKQEAVIRFGPPVGPVVLIAPPLFEEANRTRAFVMTLARALGDLSLASMVPDLPGTNESLLPTADATLDEWQAAFAAAAISASRHGPVHIAAIRGGVLVDRLARAKSRWHFAPVSGEALVRDMLRARQIANPGWSVPETIDRPLELAGNIVSPAMIAQLRAAAPAASTPVRTIRLYDDTMPSDRAVEGPPLWRRSEPGNDLIMAAVLAADLEHWVRQCEN